MTLKHISARCGAEKRINPTKPLEAAADFKGGISMGGEPLLRVEQVGKAYFGNRVLKNISFSLEKGHILGLVGENGAGKSTLMNIIFGMEVIA